MLQLQRTKRPCIGIVAECASPPQKAEQGTQRVSAKAWVIEYARGVLCLLAHVSSLSSWDFRVFFSRGNTQASLPTTTIVAYILIMCKLDIDQMQGTGRKEEL